MTKEQIILSIAAFVLTHAGTIVAAFIWGFKHVLKYNLLIKKVDKIERDLDQAHINIRKITDGK